MKDIYVLGAGGLAKEVFLLIDAINKAKPSFNFKGFVDVAAIPEGLKIGSRVFPVLEQGKFLETSVSSQVSVAFGMGSPGIIKKVVSRFADFEFPNLIHPDNFGDFEDMKMGRGNIITAGCSFTTDIQLGSFNLFNLNSTVGHDSVVGDYNVINPGVNISGGVTIGSENLIGTGATVLQYLNIGSNSILGAGALLIKDLESKKMAVGVPAKVVKEL